MTSKKNKPQVSIIMGSKSDLEVMSKAEDILKDFKVSYELKIVSAHRTPEYMNRYAKEAQKRGVDVIIAGAGGAAHLPGMVASMTTLPVIGVPIDITSLQGLDSYLSIVQMPKGVPVATVAIDNSTNAALLAIRMLALKSKRLRTSLEDFRLQQRKKVKDQNKETQTS